MRVLALDHGSARCGCALSDPTGTLATPIEPVLRPDTRRGYGHRTHFNRARSSQPLQSEPRGVLGHQLRCQCGILLRSGRTHLRLTFPQDLQELMEYFQPGGPGNGVHAVPGEGLDVPVYLLGSSDFSAQLAAEMGPTNVTSNTPVRRSTANWFMWSSPRGSRAMAVLMTSCCRDR